jgi:hypothetical protein
VFGVPFRDAYGHEVWQIHGADPNNPYVAPSRR